MPTTDTLTNQSTTTKSEELREQFEKLFVHKGEDCDDPAEQWAWTIRGSFPIEVWTWFEEKFASTRTKALEEGREDKERLDFLDRCNLALNKKYGTNYGWKLIINHNITRLMSERGTDDIDLNDANGGNDKLKSCRDAIDQQINAFTTDKEPKL